ncbi:MULTISPECIES: LPXTG cell wall anchor domain-containing protein [unclassified Curtobacterium]|uniref:LPXTG cell wall anchor domain-containing protein n=1 Tax=unclassified Curtobacterium TaxID=257496 RepID=UPI001AE9069F|nr:MULTISPECIES: LPXTG cell wall anchor domain-containing protein [unclassified Curtobacterium]MBP1300789.1 LPXTG-motif cell wall-anchored protein [Curtobacterium sp. 1310]MDB6427296.1 LPXTG cell wall anchor domain-containing protein [Curtobacterium sp. 20TX0008]
MFQLRVSTNENDAAADGHGSTTDHQETPMQPLRLTFVVAASMVGSVVTLAAAAIVMTALAAITGAPTSVPGLITATPGDGPTLATASTGDATTVWFIAVTLAFVTADLLVIRRRRSRTSRDAATKARSHS